MWTVTALNTVCPYSFCLYCTGSEHIWSACWSDQVSLTLTRQAGNLERTGRSILNFTATLQVCKTGNMQDSGLKMKNVFSFCKLFKTSLITFRLFFDAYRHIGRKNVFSKVRLMISLVCLFFKKIFQTLIQANLLFAPITWKLYAYLHSLCYIIFSSTNWTAGNNN